MITASDTNRYNQLLTKVAKHKSFGKFSMGASLYYRNKFVGEAYNAYPKRRAGETYNELYKGIGVHAELAAVYKYDVNGCTLYLAGVNSNLTEITSKPCPRCNNLLLNSSIKHIVYNVKDVGLIKVSRDDLTLLEIPEYK